MQVSLRDLWPWEPELNLLEASSFQHGKRCQKIPFFLKSYQIRDQILLSSKKPNFRNLTRRVRKTQRRHKETLNSTTLRTDHQNFINRKLKPRNISKSIEYWNFWKKAFFKTNDKGYMEKSVRISFSMYRHGHLKIKLCHSGINRNFFEKNIYSFHISWPKIRILCWTWEYLEVPLFGPWIGWGMFSHPIFHNAFSGWNPTSLHGIISWNFNTARTCSIV